MLSKQRAMKAKSNINVTCTLNADDIVTLIEEGELSAEGVVIGTTEPELSRLRQMLSETVK